MNKIAKVFAGLLVSLTFLSSAVVQAQEKAAVLRIEIVGNVEARIRSDIESVTTKTFEQSKAWSLEPADVVRGKLKPVVRDCFTEDCLKSAGESLGLRTGFAVKFTGEAQIYEWTLTFYDFRTGSVLNSVKGTCELCGQAEVSKSYTRSLTNLMDATKVPEKVEVAAGAAVQTGQEAGEPKTRRQEGVRLRISVVPAEADIYLADALVGQGDLTLPVGSGRHEVRFSREGYRGLTETVLVNENSPESILLRVHLSKTPAAPGVVRSAGDGPIDRLGDSRAMWGWVGVGSGAALLTTGIVLAAIDGNSTCADGVPYSRCPEIRATAGGAVVMSTLGGALLTAGVGLLTWELLSGNSGSSTESKSDEPGPSQPSRVSRGEASGVRLAPSFGLDGAGLQLMGRF